MSWGSSPDQVTRDVDLAERGEASRHQSEVPPNVDLAERGEASRHQREETTGTAPDPEVPPPAFRREVRQVSLMGDVRHRIGDLQSAAGVDTQQVASPQHPTMQKLPEGTSMTTRSAAAAATALRWSDVDNVKKDAEQPRFRFGFRSSIIGAIFLAVLLSCGGMYSVLFVSTTRISEDTRESCSRAVEVQDKLISRLVYRNVTLESYSSILTNMTTMVIQCVQEPSDKAVDALWNAMRTWRRFGNPITGNSSALKREEVEYLTWASLTSQWELPAEPVISRQSWLMSQPHVDSISVSFLSGQYTGAQYTFGALNQGPLAGTYDFPVAHALDKVAGDETVLGWQLTEEGNRIEPPWSYTPYDPTTRPYFTIQQSIYDRAAAGPGGAAYVAAKRAWSKVYKYTSNMQTGMSWTSPVAYCGNYSCFEGVVSADVTLEHVDAELTERWTELEKKLRTEFNFKISPENASLFIVHHVCGHPQGQAGLLIGASHESLSIPDNNLTWATESPQEVVRTTAKAIEAKFMNWSSPELKSGMRDFTYRVGGILQDPPQVIDCEPEVVPAVIDPLCRRVATLPVALDEHTQWLVVVVLPVGAFTERAQASSTLARSQVAKISNMSKDRVMEARIIGFCICGGMLVLSMFVGFFLGSMVSWPLQKLSKLMRLLGELDFAHKSLEWTELRKGRRSRVKDIDRLQNTFWNLSRGIEAFAHFVPETVVRNIVRGDPRSTRLHVSRREVTVMFSDIKDFTAISESLSQRDLLFVLTRYLSVMTTIVEMFEGVVAEVLGDGLLVFWNTPDDVQDHAAKACAAALAMQEAVVLLNVELESLSLLQLAVRIGIHTGDVLSGNIGSVAKMKFGCLGDPVNTASRLEGLCKHYQVGIICSSATHDMFAGNSGLFCRRLDLVQLKGKTVPMTIYEVIGHSLDEAPSGRSMHLGSCMAASSGALVSPMTSDATTPKAIAGTGRGCCMRMVRCHRRRKMTGSSSSQDSIGSCGASIVSSGLDVARQVYLQQAQDTIAPEQRLYVQSYEAALAAFQRGDFELSYDLTSRLDAENPGDTATRSLRDRAWANRGLSESELETWTGVLRMDSK